MSKQTGGPAFPREDYQANGGNGQLGQEGMTLRDYFAAKYMQAHVTGWLASDNDYPNLDNVAAYAYAQADAMLAERAK